MPHIKKIDHIAIATKNLSQSLDFFEKSLGIRCEKVEELPSRGIRVAFLPIGDTRIELIEPISENSEISTFLEKRGPGLHHIALESSNIKEDYDHLKEKGINFTSEISKGAHNSDVAFIHPKSSQGVLIELMQPTRN